MSLMEGMGMLNDLSYVTSPLAGLGCLFAMD